jgi:hypothetical protein
MKSTPLITIKLLRSLQLGSVRIWPIMLLVITLLVGCEISEQPAVPKPTLTVVSANMANAITYPGSITWKDKADRFVSSIVETGTIPDIISMTESSGWTYCGFDTTGDYDMVDRLISNLKNRTGITYRIAYMVGQFAAKGGGGVCHFYTGDTVLYNPNRVTNVTPDDVAGKPQVVHDANFRGSQIRRSLPICNRGTTLEPLEGLIDGPPQTDKCGRSTPSGPVWVLVERLSNGTDAMVASLARFSVVGSTGSSFDVFTVHPTCCGEESGLKAPINDFIDALTGPSYRGTNPYYPTIVLGDFNALARTYWPSGTNQVFAPEEDVMAIALGNSSGPLTPVHSLQLTFISKLPSIDPCRFYEDKNFSDHCGLLVQFVEQDGSLSTPTECEPLRGEIADLQAKLEEVMSEQSLDPASGVDYEALIKRTTDQLSILKSRAQQLRCI